MTGNTAPAAATGATTITGPRLMARYSKPSSNAPRTPAAADIDSWCHAGAGCPDAASTATSTTNPAACEMTRTAGIGADLVCKPPAKSEAPQAALERRARTTTITGPQAVGGMHRLVVIVGSAAAVDGRGGEVGRSGKVAGGNEVGGWPRACLRRSVSRRAFALVPQSAMPHQRRDLFFVASKNTQPQPSVPWRQTPRRLASFVVRISTADLAIS